MGWRNYDKTLDHSHVGKAEFSGFVKEMLYPADSGAKVALSKELYWIVGPQAVVSVDREPVFESCDGQFVVDCFLRATGCPNPGDLRVQYESEDGQDQVGSSLILFCLLFFYDASAVGSRMSLILSHDEILEFRCKDRASMRLANDLIRQFGGKVR